MCEFIFINLLVIPQPLWNLKGYSTDFFATQSVYSGGLFGDGGAGARQRPIGIIPYELIAQLI